MVGESQPDRFTVGWIGTPHTAKYLLSISEPLRRLHAGGGVRFRFIGAPPGLNLGVPYEAVPWSEATEVAELRKLDCGLMPLLDEPFERGKSGYKLVQYMACGLPVVASPVGVNCSIVADDSCGYLARDAADWLGALTRLKNDRQLARRLGAQGRRTVESRFDTNKLVDVLAEVLIRARSLSS